ncbi:GNAT family N-acetyltransferase [Blastococcus goldschmidtiae]|uniref:GNAT family N-acetyltransferase n=1 Tax=Blastococcus goldschmidtiae TaxID=3075546 RepID=A0ABU2KAA2_9ACTN|nr:GNAT family N-acetyltransferase [Blastococcus sp. DSM 46792]MDT0277107.1 GNAT family N-acetyltransferase [Blastococcus sp. DSM 46792]
MDVRDLSRSDLESPQFLHLLWLATEADDLSLRRIRANHLPRLAVAGIVADGVVVGFVAYDQGDSQVVMKYIATAESRRGMRIGSSLVHELQRRHPGLAISAQTDDDAIGFYRKLGFTDTAAPRDSRWPVQQRYDCLLSATLTCTNPHP